MKPLPEKSTRVVPAEWNTVDYQGSLSKCVHEIFEEIAFLTPEAVAVVCEGRKLTYSELRARAIVLSRELIGLGIGHESIVGLVMNRSPELILGMIAVLYAGAAYLPIDPLFPTSRIQYMLNDSNAKVLCSDEGNYASALKYSQTVIKVDSISIDHDKAFDPPVTSTGPPSLAYVMYTSGSTGTPKGVQVMHRGITRLVHGDFITFGPDEVFLHLSSPAFDASTLEVWGSLLHGAKCVIMPQRVPSVTDIAEIIKIHNITTVWLTATYFNTIVDEAPDALCGIRQLLIGGEALSVRHVRLALTALPETTIINGYGPTENTTFTCCYTIPRDLDTSVTSIPIGSAIRGTTVYVLDSARVPVPDGQEGELYAGGDGVARGYLNRTDLTDSLFLRDPFSERPDARMYKTGDLVRRRADGVVEFIGRVDDQVKIRGFRIEPAEIQAVLSKHPSVRAVAVLPQTDSTGEKHLVAYVVPNGNPGCEQSDFRSFAAQKLPEFMQPSFFVILEKIPLNLNGKIDRQALPLPWGQPNPIPVTQYENEIEGAIANVWLDVLGKAVSPDQNLFEAGARSLHMVRVQSRLQGVLKKKIDITALFQYPTVKSLSVYLEGEDDQTNKRAASIRDRAKRQMEAMTRQRLSTKRLR